jgi:hypothetical protein
MTQSELGMETGIPERTLRCLVTEYLPSWDWLCKTKLETWLGTQPPGSMRQKWI